MIDCIVAGASGLVGQRFISLLSGHPLFRVVGVTAGPDRQGAKLGAAKWHLHGVCPPELSGLHFMAIEAVEKHPAKVIFSALPSAQAGPFEAEWAAAGKAVFTNASPHRMDANVPLLIPEINAQEIETVRDQVGFIVANGNCGGIIVTLPLAALEVAFGIESAHVITQQAISGAGIGGVAPGDIHDNLIPFIQGEESKLETEPQKTIGADFPIQATCTRVNVSDGHFATLHVRLKGKATWDEVEQALANFSGSDEVSALYSSPKAPILVRTEADRPQPRLDRDAGDGMSVVVGRIRLAENGRDLRLVVLGHNTIRGAAGQSVLNAELAAARGLI